MTDEKKTYDVEYFDWEERHWVSLRKKFDDMVEICADYRDMQQKYIATKAENTFLHEWIDAARDAIEKIDNWTKAYPLDIFPEPDLKRARELLAVGGITIDAVSASAMRHVIKGVKELSAKALACLDKAEGEDGQGRGVNI